MLWPDDADLVGRDAAVPGLATVLDPEALLEAIRPSVRPLPGRLHPTIVRYKPGTRCLVGFRIDCGDGETVDGYAVAHGADAATKLRKHDERPSIPGPLGPGRLALGRSAIVVSFFPNDFVLRSLAGLGEGLRETLARILPTHPEWWGGRLRTLGYKPERRWVGELSVGGMPCAALKVYTDTGYRAASLAVRRLEPGGCLWLPRRIGHSRRRRILAFEWNEGRLLAEAIADPAFDAGLVAHVGAALAELHRGSARDLPVSGREDEAASLLALGADLGDLVPRLAGRAADLAARLAAALRAAPALACPVHGDFYPKQVLLDGERVVVLDLDRAAAGDPALDLGLFLAHVERERLRGAVPAGRPQAIREALVGGYEAATGEVVSPRVELYLAAGLLRLAPDPFRYREEDWPERIEAILERANGALEAFGTASGRSGFPRGRHAAPVADAHGAVTDPGMPILRLALDPCEAGPRLARPLGTEELRVLAIRVRRHKPGRRCLIEYDLALGDSRRTIIGKTRARRLGQSGWRVQDALSRAGFGADGADGVSVPATLGIVPELHMWLQEKVAGEPATGLLANGGGVVLAGRIAAALGKLHATAVPAGRRHGPAEELAILRERFERLVVARPAWTGRLERLLGTCERLAAELPRCVARGIHRDFHPDQILVDGPRLVLVDFDLYSEGDPALDAGNFLAHLTEQALRMLGDSRALADREGAFEETFLELSGVARRAAVRIYTTLALARHVSISTEIAERRPWSESLLDLCEERLGLARRAA